MLLGHQGVTALCDLRVVHAAFARELVICAPIVRRDERALLNRILGEVQETRVSAVGDDAKPQTASVMPSTTQHCLRGGLAVCDRGAVLHFDRADDIDLVVHASCEW